MDLPDPSQPDGADTWSQASTVSETQDKASQAPFLGNRLIQGLEMISSSESLDELGFIRDRRGDLHGLPGTATRRQPRPRSILNFGPPHFVQNQTPDNPSVLAKIEKIFEQLIDSLARSQTSMSVDVRTRSSAHCHHLDIKNGEIRPTANPIIRKVCFPGRKSKEAWKFTVIVRILEMIHEILCTGRVITKRDIFYQDPALFIEQVVVDRCVDDLAFTLGVQRTSLNVVWNVSQVATAKGLTIGPIIIIQDDGSKIDCTTDQEVEILHSYMQEGTLIPSGRAIRELDITNAEWILVIEKEASFRSLASTGFWRDCRKGMGIMITAKGYPDISTRTFLSLLSILPPHGGRPSPQVYALVDYDPDGICILSTFKYGSAALAHENAGLGIRTMNWIGPLSSDIERADAAIHRQGLLALCPRDRRNASKLLEKDIFAENGPEPMWRREVQVMLMLNLKAEIQILGDVDGGLHGWLNEKLTTELRSG